MTNAPTQTIEVPAAELKQWLDHGQCVLVDVREDIERSEERIPGSVGMPLSRLDPQALLREHPGARLVFHCKGGKRAAKACSLMVNGNDGALYHLQGGIDGWKAAKLPTASSDNPPRIPLMRQVLLVAGMLVSLGLALGWFVHPGFLLLSAFVGCGLMFSGATGYCGMAMVLAKMPWNR